MAIEIVSFPIQNQLQAQGSWPGARLDGAYGSSALSRRDGWKTPRCGEKIDV